MKLEFKNYKSLKKSKNLKAMQVNALYSKYFDRIQVDIFDISKVLAQINSSVERFDESKDAATLDAELIALVAFYRKN